jgi:putative DNA primase/helicase
VTAVRPLHQKPKASPGGWTRGLITNDDGTPKKGLANVMHVMSTHPAWEQVLAYNAFIECAVKMLCPPVREQDGVSALGEWTDADSARTAAWFASVVGFEPSTQHVDQAVVSVAERCSFHPVRDYLRAQTWDGVGRLDHLLATHFGARDSAYTRAIGARWMISAVARVMSPGCQADCMLVLEGEQGAGKSTGFEALFSQEWFADTGLSIGDKDSYQALRGKWGYELGELDSIKGREVTRVKNFLSARTDTYRPSYGKRTRDFRRQNVFCGTTNEDHYLVDKRRFWPVLCSGTVNRSGIARDRDQLWAEAHVRYQQGEAWHVDTPELRKLCEAEQQARTVEDPWNAVIARWLNEQVSRGAIDPARGVEMEAVLSGAINLPTHKQNHIEATRAGKAMWAADWRPRQRRVNGQRVRFYHPLSHLPQPEDGEGL